MPNLKLIYHYLKTLILYKPFFRQARGRVVVIRPLLITPRCLVSGKQVFIRDHARIEGVSRYNDKQFFPLIELGDFVSIEQNLHLTCADNVRIGNNTAIAAGVTITDINHPYEDIDLPPEKQDITARPVVIGDDCKIYNNAVILPGTILGKHCVVGANSVVRGNRYEDYSILSGIPAIVVKRYSPEENKWLKTMPDGSFIK